MLSESKFEAVTQEATKRLVGAAHPDKIILFGSYVRGDFDEDSDLDLLVILPMVDNNLMRRSEFAPPCNPLCRTRYHHL